MSKPDNLPPARQALVVEALRSMRTHALDEASKHAATPGQAAEFAAVARAIIAAALERLGYLP